MCTQDKERNSRRLTFSYSCNSTWVNEIMKRAVDILVGLLCALSALTVLAVSDEVAAQDRSSDAARSVQVRDITLKVPLSWKQERPTSRLRLTQFRVPAAQGDREDAELIVFNFGDGGGGVEANIRRWIDQFQPAGRKVRTVSGNSTQGKYYLADVSGTYNRPDGPPFLRRTKPVSDFRSHSVILLVENKGVYFLKLIGPRKTVSDSIAQFRASFGAGSADEEKDYKLTGE